MIGAPLYNFTIPTGLKAWIEVVRAPGLAIGAEVRAHSLAKARGQIREMFVAQPA